MKYSGPGRSGLTLFEILVVLALMAVVAGLVTLNFDRLIAAAEAPPIERVLARSIQEARIRAANGGHPVYLSFDAERGAFTLVERSQPAESALSDAEQLGPSDPAAMSSETVLERFPCEAARGLGVEFYPRLSSPNFNARAEDFARDPVPSLVFHPSGVSTPARVVIRQSGTEALTFELDPMSSGPLPRTD